MFSPQKRLVYLAGALIVALLLGAALSTAQEDSPTPWEAWASIDVATLGDDNSGSTFAISSDVASPDGNPTVQITPSGTSEETKMAVTVSGADLQAWRDHGTLTVEVYLPEESALNPNRFFLGMADTTGDFVWVGGIFSETEVQPGWNEVTFALDPAMREPAADATYTLFFSFFNENAEAVKTPLTEPIFIGDMTLSGMGASAEATTEAGEATESAETEATAAAEPTAEATTPAPDAGGESALWEAWENKDITTITDDNSGSTFAESSDVLSPAGNSTLEVTPNGESLETKLAVPLTGADLAGWETAAEVVFEVYLPEDNALNATRFFMGLAETTTEWTWVGGIFSETEAQPGWNEISFTPDALMRDINPDGTYLLFLSFFYEDEAQNKTALTEPFYLGSAYLRGDIGGGEAIAWQAWADQDIAALDDDNSGSTFAESSDVLSPAGDPTLEVTPGGAAEETKLAFTVTGDQLAEWAAAGEVIFEVYLPPENTLNPNRAFLGMADVTGEWTWVGGLTSESEFAPEWNRIVFEPDAAMQDIDPEHTYTLYLSLFNEVEGVKTPLTEPFYLGGVFFAGGPQDAEAQRVPEWDAEAEELASAELDVLIDTVARETFDYFWLEANPENGLIKDRSTEDSPSSIAAVGFGLSAIPVGIDRGWISYDEGYDRTLITLQTFASGGVEGERGFFYHFVHMETGRRVWSSELSSIDTALFIAGALTAAEYFAGTEVETLANDLYERIEWDWMMGDGNMVSMGWFPESGFLDATWSGFDEGLLLYVLAIGSPTHPVPVETWDRIIRPVDTEGEYIYIAAEPLFVYQYPLAWLDLREQSDAYANYFNNAGIACARNRQFSQNYESQYATYRNGVWGISASDGPAGYRAYGSAEGNHDGTIAPYASASCLPMRPELAVDSMRAMLHEYGSLAWREYGFVSAINEEVGWYSVEHIGIDQGDILLMIANYQDDFVWNLFMQNEHVQRGLEAIGFEEDAAFAVSPEFLADARETEEAARQPVTATQAGEISVDGTLDDWADATWHTVTREMNVPSGGINPVAEDIDLSSEFAAVWSADTLYLAARVVDPTVVSNIAPDDLQGFYRTDSVEFYLNPGAGGSQAGLFKLAVIPFDTEGNVQAVRHEDAAPGPIAETAPGVQVASSATDDGYIIEVAIPLSLLGLDGQAGTQIGFSHVIHNASNAEAEVGAYARENIIGWNPLPNIWQAPEAWSVLRFE